MNKTRTAALILACILLLFGGCAAAAEGTSPANAAPPETTEHKLYPASPTAEPEAAVSELPPEPAAATTSEIASTPGPAADLTPSAVQTPESGPMEEISLTCDLWIRCDTILDNMDKLAEEKEQLVPEDGVLLCAEEMPFEPGESVFDLLIRVTREQELHLEFVDTPFYGSAYIEGIGNLYEFDCGELSGWSYKVNGTFPGYGCSQYQLSDGDVVEWVYTCDLGKDVGGSNR